MRSLTIEQTTLLNKYIMDGLCAIGLGRIANEEDKQEEPEADYSMCENGISLAYFFAQVLRGEHDNLGRADSEDCPVCLSNQVDDIWGNERFCYDCCHAWEKIADET